MPFLDSALDNTAVMAVVSYALFSANPAKNPALVITVPIVYYAIAHYKFLVTVEPAAKTPIASGGKTSASATACCCGWRATWRSTTATCSFSAEIRRECLGAGASANL
ncbi:MAG: hypothetical protein HC918_13340 [Oscillatoriales cyanobacterium SM2_1_8]|nr:hypothetical protein [Oscillatoriales cyanobacterium SM2_1_8]